jgi:hypothetical protein
MRVRLRPLALLVALGVLHASPAVAASPSDEARAEERFHEGQRLFEAHQLEAAATALLESEQLDPQLGTLINLALCHEAMGHAATAMHEFEVAAAWAAQRKQADREQYARQHAAELAKHAGAVHLQMPEGAGRITVSIDGEPIPPGQWAMPVFLDAGPHSVHVTAPGMQEQDLPLAVAAGASDQLLTIPRPVPVAVETIPMDPPPPAPEEGGDPRRPLGLVAGGVGLVALSLASYLVAHDGRASAEAIAAGASGGIVLGGGAFLYFSAGPATPRPTPAAQCATIGLSTTW